jgi:hypothetical protein
MTASMRLAMVATLLTCAAPAAAQPSDPPTVRTEVMRCGRAGRAQSRILASPDRARQVWAELVVTIGTNRCSLRWVLHASTDTGTTFRAVPVSQAPPLNEQNEFEFALVGFADGGSRVLAVQAQWIGRLKSVTVVVYDFATRTVLTQDVNARVDRLVPDECPALGNPTGLVSADTVALAVASFDEVDDTFRCWPETMWGLDVTTGALRRLGADARVMAAGTALGHPSARQASGSRRRP